MTCFASPWYSCRQSCEWLCYSPMIYFCPFVGRLLRFSFPCVMDDEPLSSCMPRTLVLRAQFPSAATFDPSVLSLLTFVASRSYGRTRPTFVPLRSSSPPNTTVSRLRCQSSTTPATASLPSSLLSRRSGVSLASRRLRCANTNVECAKARRNVGS